MNLPVEQQLFSAVVLKKLQQKFPVLFSDESLDIELLYQYLMKNQESTQHYELNFNGKNEAYKEVLKPAKAVLEELQDQSVNGESAKHIFIEGDNLEVLKILQDEYRSKIKLIYIDPPYNTGNDNFVYADNFHDSKTDYLEKIGKHSLKSGDFRNNLENGRLHSGWLSFMLPRLVLAHLLLKEDGVIFISIDDKEQANLKLLLDEIFGEENFVANMIRENKTGSGHDSGSIAVEYDYTLMYAKNKSKLSLNKIALDVENDKKYRHVDEFVETRGKYYLRDLDYKGTYSVSGDYEMTFPSGKRLFSGGRFGPPNTWRWGREKLEWGIKNNFIVFDEKKEKVYLKQYQFVDNKGLPYERKIPYRALTRFMNARGSLEVDALLGKGIFSFPKSTEMIRYYLDMVIQDEQDIVLDFFAGSGTTAHAVMEFNRDKTIDLTSISVQLPEATDEKSEAFKQGYQTIADISFARIRKVIENQMQDSAAVPKNLGIRKFKLKF